MRSGLEGVTSPFAQPPSQQQQLPPAHSGLGSVSSMRRGWGDGSSPTIRETTSSSPKFLAKLSSGGDTILHLPIFSPLSLTKSRRDDKPLQASRMLKALQA